MCEYCVKHGSGKKWYLEARNYFRNFQQNDKKRKEFTEDFIEHFMITYEKFLQNREFNQVLKDTDLNWFKKLKLSAYFKYYHSGQVIPKEEAKMIMDLAGQISLIPCVCRYANSGEKHHLCFLFMATPDNLFGSKRFDRIRDVETLTVEEAQSQVEVFAKQGYVQTVWTFLSPHIGAVCNCDYPYCTAIRFRRHTDLRYSLFKAEFIAEINKTDCVGCGNCVSKCQFGALSLSASLGKAVINPNNCFGCGVCRMSCEHEAISLIPRTES